jgi:hypothetical protein
MTIIGMITVAVYGVELVLGLSMAVVIFGKLTGIMK